MGKDDKRKDTVKRQREQSKRMNKMLDRASDCISAISEEHTAAGQLAAAAKASELLSSVWSLSPAQQLMFQANMSLTDVDPGSTLGFEGAKADGGAVHRAVVR